MSEFAKLLDELGVEDLSKALKPGEADTAGDDGKIAAAAAEGDSAGGEDEDEGEGEALGKSFKITLDDGSEVDAVDGTALVKALVARVEGNETATLKAVKGLVEVVKPLTDLVKSLQGEVTTLKNAGKGRKAVLTVAAPAAPTEEELKKSRGSEGGMDAVEFMAKSDAALVAGRITGREVALIEQHINAGQQPPAHLVSKVLG